MRLLLGAALVFSPAASRAQAPSTPAPQAAPAPAPAVPEAPAQVAPRAEPQWEDPTLEQPAAAGEEQESLGWTLFRTLMLLGAVVAAIYLTLNVGLRRLMGLQGASLGRQPLVSVVERLTLDPKRSLFVVKAADDYLLVGGGEGGLQLLSKLDPEAVARIREQRPQAPVVPMSPFLQKLLSRRTGGSQSQPPSA
ncbi:MAG TPA: flagellar biosynthetic protein FliO [Myxococcus sp.]|jgi:flagellar protein FliO/FliZ|nr:flagellar biosynthetic protein FliO [Myxococcus sp.]